MKDLTAPPADARVTVTDLLAAISAVGRSARRASGRPGQAGLLPAAQLELLALAAARPGISVTGAARELRLAPNTVSTLAGRLAAQGLLRRERTLPDGRAVRLAVTSRAQRRLASWRGLRTGPAQAAIDRLTPADREALASAVPALLRLAGQLAAA